MYDRAYNGACLLKGVHNGSEAIQQATISCWQPATAHDLSVCAVPVWLIYLSLESQGIFNISKAKFWTTVIWSRSKRLVSRINRAISAHRGRMFELHWAAGLWLQIQFLAKRPWSLSSLWIPALGQGFEMNQFSFFFQKNKSPASPDLPSWTHFMACK